MDKNHKYYSLIEKLVRNHKKFVGLEPIIDNIIDYVYEEIKDTIEIVGDESVIEKYANRVISFALVKVPAEQNFKPEIPNYTNIEQTQDVLPRQEKPVNDDNQINLSVSDTQNNSIVLQNTTSDKNQIDIDCINKSDYNVSLLSTDLDDVNNLKNANDNEYSTDVNKNLVDSVINGISTENFSDELQISQNTNQENFEDSFVSDETDIIKNYIVDGNSTILQEINLQESNLELNFTSNDEDIFNSETDTEELLISDSQIEQNKQFEISSVDDQEFLSANNSVEKLALDNTLDSDNSISIDIDNSQQETLTLLDDDEITDNIEDDYDDTDGLYQTTSVQAVDDSEVLLDINDQNSLSDIAPLQSDFDNTELTIGNEPDDLLSDSSVSDNFIQQYDSDLELTSDNELETFDSSISDANFEDSVEENDNGFMLDIDIPEEVEDISSDSSFEEIGLQAIEEQSGNNIGLQNIGTDIEVSSLDNNANISLIQEEIQQKNIKPAMLQTKNIEADEQSIINSLIQLSIRSSNANILEICDLKYKRGYTISQISEHLRISQETVISALSDIISII